MIWKPSKTQARAYAEQMDAIGDFCAAHGIERSFSGDSYYFCLNGKQYRISNHSVESSNRRAYDPVTGEQRRELYHEHGREQDTVYIHASKTRIAEIYTDLAAGYELDGRGFRK